MISNDSDSRTCNPFSREEEEEEEDRKWQTLFQKPSVQQALARLVEEVIRQEECGETEEGGFADEHWLVQGETHKKREEK